MNAMTVTRDRLSRIGASDGASVLNMNPYRNAYAVWLEKTGQLAEWAGNDATADGQLYEPLLLDRAEQKLGELKRDVFLPSPDGLPIGATLDAIVLGTNDVVEAKTTGLGDRPITGNWGEEGTSDIPDHYLIQTQLQMHCAGSGVAHVVAWIGHKGVKWYRVERDDEVIRVLTEELSAWWQKHVIGGVAPSVKQPPAVEVLSRIRREPAKSILLGKVADKRIAAWERAKARLKKAQQKEQESKAKLLLMLGDAERGTSPSGAAVTYYESERRGYTVQPAKYRTLKVQTKESNNECN